MTKYFIILVFLASLIHVFSESRKDLKVGNPIRHTLMVAIVLWPLGYLLWLFYWPGTLRKFLFQQGQHRTKHST
jgi:hypothetical protein